MKETFIFFICAGLLFVSCSKQPVEKPVGENPFFSEYDTPFKVPPFDEITEEHYLPAFKEGIVKDQKEIDVIVNNPEGPTFANSIEALDYTGDLLTKVENVFYNLLGSNTNDQMQEIAKEVAPLLSKHGDDIRLNADLFKRVKAVYETKNELSLTPEQAQLLEKTYKVFVRGGANLGPEEQARLREINKELSLLSLIVGENILKENNAFEMVLENEEDLAGLPQSAIIGAEEAAKERGKEGKWVFTLHKPSMIPFLQYSEKREFREKIFKAYINRGNNNDELDNKTNLSKMAALRVEKANLLGYDTHADFVLENNMAKKPDNVYKLLEQIWKPALAKAKVEAKDLWEMSEMALFMWRINYSG